MEEADLADAAVLFLARSFQVHPTSAQKRVTSPWLLASDYWCFCQFSFLLDLLISLDFLPERTPSLTESYSRSTLMSIFKNAFTCRHSH